MKEYKVSWIAADILDKRPNWTTEEAERWLDKNFKYIEQDMVARGWDSIDTLLSMDEEGAT